MIYLKVRKAKKRGTSDPLSVALIPSEICSIHEVSLTNWLQKLEQQTVDLQLISSIISFRNAMVKDSWQLNERS